MKALVIAMITVGLTTRLCALDDTPANRAKLAGKLIQTFPIQDLWESLERQIPEQQRELANALFQHVNWKSFTKSIQQILTETYTADEIKALTDAYSSPVFRSILRKQGSSFLSADELRAAQEFFSSSIGQSILKKQRIYLSKLKPMLGKELVKAWNNMRDEAETMKHSSLAAAKGGR